MSLSVYLNQTGFELTFSKSFPVKCNSFKVDMLGNIYTIENGSLIKYSEAGDKIKQYNNKYLGSISYFDVSDPFRILLFYKDFNQVLFLDNYLVEIMSPVQLDQLKVEQTEIACSSPQGGFWVFDNYSKKLIYFDKNLQKQQESIGMNSIPGGNGKPTFLIEKNDFLYMNIPETGILIFDKYGAYFKTLNLGQVNDFQVSDGKIIYQLGNAVFKYDLKFITTTSIDFPDSLKNAKTSNVLKNKLFLLRENKISVYNIKEN